MAQKITMEFLKNRPISQSRIKYFRKSPKHYVHSFDEPYVSKDHNLLGSAVDILLIDGEEGFNKEFLPYTDFPKRSNDAKAEWQKLIETARDEKKLLITNDIIENARACVQAIKDYPDAQPYLNMRKKHPRLYWTNRETGVPCVTIPDWDCLLDEQLCIVDLKVMSDADPDEFTRASWKWEYFMQVGAELDAYKSKFFQFPMFVFLVVESGELHNVSINFVEGKYIDFCRAEWEGTLKAFRYCLDNDLWHMGYEFRLMGTRSYFALRKPGYGRALFSGWE